MHTPNTPQTLAMHSALAEYDDSVRALFVESGRRLVDVHGASMSVTMLPLFESYLDGSAAVPESSGGGGGHAGM